MLSEFSSKNNCFLIIQNRTSEATVKDFETGKGLGKSCGVPVLCVNF